MIRSGSKHIISLLLVITLVSSLFVPLQGRVAASEEEGDPVPLLARYDFAPPGGNAASTVIQDTGGQGYDGSIFLPVAGTNHYVASGRTDADGHALWLPGGKWSDATNASLGNINAASSNHLINKADLRVTLSAWVNISGEFFQYNPVIGKKNNGGVPAPYTFGIYGGLLIPDNENNSDPNEPSPPDEERGKSLYFEADTEGGKYKFYSDPIEMDLDEWAHVAVVFEKGVGLQFYFNGELAGSVEGTEVPYGLAQNTINLQIGRDWFEMWSPFQNRLSNRQYRLGGMLDSVRIYAAALDEEQVVQDMNDTLATRAAVENDVSKYQTMPVDMYLVRYDMPIGFQERMAGNGRTRQAAERLIGSGVDDAVDWPQIKLNQYWEEGVTDELYPFEDGSSKRLDIVQADASVVRSHFQENSDHVVSPGNHWFRGILGRYSRLEISTSDRTARTGTSGYELWTFPVIIEGQSAGDVTNVVLSYNGEEIYNTGSYSYDSLTLLLPQNEDGIPYELSVNGSTFSFDVGLKPVIPGDPKDELIELDEQSGIYTVRNLDRPQTFPNQAAWDADVAALAGAKPQPLEYERDRATIESHLGIEVPRSPVEINFIGLPHGMTGGGYNYKTGGNVSEYKLLGPPDQYASYLADTGYDRVYEQTLTNSLNDASDPKSYDKLAVALAERGIQFGTVPGGNYWNVPFAQHPNIPFFTHNLPHYRAPLYRTVQLEAQRLGQYNFTGINIGADNAGYESFWSWAPNMIDTPWGEAFANFNNDKNFKIPLIPSSSAVPKDFEFKADNFQQFLDAIAVYDETFKEYSYFYDAVASVDADNVTTTGSFGSSPGVLGRGGYKIGTFPGDIMFDGLPIQQAYDWNELSSSKPMHNVALIDRLRSYDPDKPTWSIIDDFDLFALERESRQKAYALALTRGVQAIGPNYIPNDVGGLARPETIAEQKELYEWIHKYGGTYAMTEPDASIGIMYVTEQALSRNTVQDEALPNDQLLRGSHEGKVTEALFFTHAAGYPSKVITPQELERGLPASMKTILLVGLREIDSSWAWYDGLEDELQTFVNNGGRILRDYESVSPVTSVSTDIQSYSYVPQSHDDWTNTLLTRNAANMTKLRTAMASADKPVAFSESETVWAVPTWSGNTQYVTVVNQQHNGKTNELIGQTGTLEWDTERPIYDVRSGEQIDISEAESVDLTADAFQYYALPAEEVTTPSVIVDKGASGFYEAVVSIFDTVDLTGIPVEITVTHQGSGDTATVHSATGLNAVLPLTDEDPEGVYQITVTELLSGLGTSTTVEIVNGEDAPDTESPVAVYREDHVARFKDRTSVPLTIALTPEQHADSDILAEANELVSYYNGLGRDAQLGTVGPNGVVLSLQTYAVTARYPQWSTVDSDLVLFGNSSNNVLLLDQARGYLLPEQGGELETGHAAVSYAQSPFVGERDVINIVADDLAGIQQAVDAVIAAQADNSVADRSAPVWPDNAALTPSGAAGTSLTLAWGAATDNAGVSAYKVYAGSELVAETSGAATSALVTELDPSASYTFRVVAYDAEGNFTAGPAATVATTGAAPAVSLSGPASAYVGSPIQVTASLQGAEDGFTMLEAVVEYDPALLEFASVLNEDETMSLAGSAITAAGTGLQVLGTGIKPDDGEILIYMANLGGAAYSGDLFQLHGTVKTDASPGTANVSLSRLVLSSEGDSVTMDTSEASAAIAIEQADRTALGAAIAAAQSLHNGATEGPAPGQYPTGSKSVLQTAINAANAVYTNVEATQPQVNAAMAALTAAVNVFTASVHATPPVNKAALDAAIQAARDLFGKAVAGTKVGQYPGTAKDTLQDAIETAEDVSESGGASQSAVDAAVTALNGAVSTFRAQIVTLKPGETQITINTLSLMAKYFGATSSDPDWSEIEAADIFDENEITIRALAAVARMIIADWYHQ